MKMDQRHAVMRYQMDFVLPLQRTVYAAWQGEISLQEKSAIQNHERWVPGRKIQSEPGCLRRKERDKGVKEQTLLGQCCQETKKGIIRCEVTKQK